jgi:hypothetical protein
MVYIPEDGSLKEEFLYFIGGAGLVLTVLFGLGWLNQQEVLSGLLDSSGGLFIGTIVVFHLVLAAIYLIGKKTDLFDR